MLSFKNISPAIIRELKSIVGEDQVIVYRGRGT